MSLSDILNAGKMQKTITALTEENESLNKEISKLKTQIINLTTNLKQETEKNKRHEEAVRSLLPLFDTSYFDIPDNYTKYMRIWNMWPDTLHDQDSQIIRQTRGCAAIYTPISLNPDFACGVFWGHEHNYNTSLTRCDCVDFQRRIRPCKHIYRLAHELDVIALEHVEVHPDIMHVLRKSDVLRLKNGLNPTQRSAFENALYSGPIFISPAVFKPLHNCRLLDEVHDDTMLLNTFSKDELYYFIQQHTTDKIRKNMSKTALIEKIISAYPIIIEKIKMTKIIAGPSIYIRHLLT